MTQVPAYATIASARPRRSAYRSREEALDAGKDISPDRAAQMAVFLASGRGDALSGRFLLATDDEEALVARVGKIKEQDLLVLRPHF